MNAYSGKRIAQNSVKVKQILKRERRLNRIGLSLKTFVTGFPAAEYFAGRNMLRALAKDGSREESNQESPMVEAPEGIQESVLESGAEEV